MSEIHYFKDIGHQLMEEYISLNPFLGDKKDRTAAYENLQKRLRKKHNAHFAMMTTFREVMDANDQLRKMIKERRKKIKLLGYDKRVYAPNLAELQKNIKFEKIG